MKMKKKLFIIFKFTSINQHLKKLLKSVIKPKINADVSKNFPQFLTFYFVKKRKLNKISFYFVFFIKKKNFLPYFPTK